MRNKEFLDINRDFETATLSDPLTYEVEALDVKKEWAEKYPLELLEPALKIAQAHRTIKEIEAKISEAKEEILNYMQANNIKKMKTIDGSVTFTFVEEKEVKRFDVKQAIEDCPALEQYYKVSKTKSYLKIN